MRKYLNTLQEAMSELHGYGYPHTTMAKFTDALFTVKF